MNKLFFKIIYILLLVVVFVFGYKFSTNEYTHYNECDNLSDTKLLEDYYFHHDDFPHDNNLHEYKHIIGDHLHQHTNKDIKNDHFHRDDHIEIKSD